MILVIGKEKTNTNTNIDSTNKKIIQKKKVDWVVLVCFSISVAVAVGMVDAAVSL